MVTEAARARRASISATSSGTSSLKGSALNSRDKGTSGLRRPRFLRAAAQIDTAVSRSFRRKPDPWCHAESVFGLVLLTGTSETPSARDLCRTEEVVLPHQRCSSLPRRPLRRVPGRALPRGAGRARRRMFHAGRVEGRAPAAIVVARELQVVAPCSGRNREGSDDYFFSSHAFQKKVNGTERKSPRSSLRTTASSYRSPNLICPTSS
jgi:hypothetical protein